MPVSRSPTNSQARATPMNNEAMIRLPRVSSALWLCQCTISSAP